MRTLSGIARALAIVVLSAVVGRTASPQEAAAQTARQALIEMFFGDAPDHLKKHLPDVTRRTIEKFQGDNGQSPLGIFSAMAAQSKTEKEKPETFDGGPTFLISKGTGGATYDKLVITVERDETVGEEERIELAPHIFKDGKEETLLPTVLRFTFLMKKETGIWRMNELSATARFPIADPAFLKGVEEYQLRENEQMAQWSMRAIVDAERQYKAGQGKFACTLSELGSTGHPEIVSKLGAYLYDRQLMTGKKNGYSFAISDCDATHYRVVAEPEGAGLGQRAFCSDESGKLRASADGKATTCLASGEVVEEKTFISNTPQAAAPASNQNNPAPRGGRPLRVRVSQGVSNGLLVNKVQPVYPSEARAAGIQGNVVLKVEITQAGDVEDVELVSGDPILASAAIDAVKQWKYKPYLLNGNPVNVETQVIVNFALSKQ
jgi:TonB family protein